MQTRPLQSLCCLTQAALFNACLSDKDLMELRAWHAAPNRHRFSPALWSRATLHRTCREEPSTAQQVSDRLDLKYLDTVVLIRAMEVVELQRLVDLWVERPSGPALPGLLWALCTDGRSQVSALGARLSHEAAIVACRLMVGAT